jgi:hypothetical protein
MTSNFAEIVQSFAAVQAELRQIPTTGSVGEFSPSSSGGDDFDDLLEGMLETEQRGTILGCRLFHWNPDLENIRQSFGVYFSHLDCRVGSKPCVFFEKLYKIKYTASGQPRSGPTAERQFGISYSGLQPKREVKPLLDAFKNCATRAGALVTRINDRLSADLAAETLAAKQDLHRWIFTVYDIAWAKPSGSPLVATRYIPVQGLDAAMRTDESVRYDIEHLRSTPWSRVKRRLDRWGGPVNLKDAYASWREKLPEYYASRIDDIVQASDWAIDWLVKRLE